MNESDQVWITQITTAYVFFLFLGVFSVVSALHNSNSFLTLSGSGVAALAAIAGIVYCTRRIGDSLRA